jgi:hypothetical protein
MSAMAILSTAGTLLQLIGVAIAAWGLRKTWTENAPEGEQFWAPVIGAARAVARGVNARLHSARLRIGTLFGRHPTTIARAGAAFGSGMALNATLRVGKQFGTLPKTMGTRHAIDELDERTRELMDRVNDVRDAAADEHMRASSEETELATRIGSVTNSLNQRVTHIAVGGMRLESLGLFMVAFGLLLQALAPLIAPT